ncbi:Predicted dehydrogenase [Phaffia rhodozyma]|uniref:Predicted dehydrogenase n=1 Tax=Phaffia rhodozyma TaxID=264483 RepID=A0A0F7SJL0_PHARH|nr:Predicted dehydrogenase [Phaffia rhodozyma]
MSQSEENKKVTGEPIMLNSISKFERSADYFPCQIPRLPYLLENLVLSLTTMSMSSVSVLTTLAMLPLSILKSLTPLPKPSPDRVQTVLITGGSGQIGGSLLKQYDSSAYHLVLLLRQPEKTDTYNLPRVATYEIIKHDLTTFDKEQTKAMVKEIAVRRGGIDVLLQVSGTAGHMEEAWSEAGTRSWGVDFVRRVSDTNVTGCVNLILATWESMIPYKKGSIVIVASSASIYAPCTFAAYGASKAYLYHLGQSLRVLSVPHNIGVTIICPGFIDSPMTKNLRKWGSTLPDFGFASPDGLAHRIRRAQLCNEGTVIWPIGQVAPLYGATSMNPLHEELGRWFGAATGATGTIIS